MRCASRWQPWRQDCESWLYADERMPSNPARTFAMGLELMRTNACEDNWFLHIETFDPHEPYFTQQHYKDLYPHDYAGPHFDWPPYCEVQESPEQVQHVRYENAALISMCDTYS